MNENRVKNNDKMIENVIEWIDGDDHVAVTLSTRYKHKLIKLAEKFPDEVSIIDNNNDGSVFGIIPLKWVVMRKPRTVNLTEEQKEERAERMRNLVMSKNNGTVLEEQTDFE